MALNVPKPPDPPTGQQDPALIRGPTPNSRLKTWQWGTGTTGICIHHYKIMIIPYYLMIQFRAKTSQVPSHFPSPSSKTLPGHRRKVHHLPQGLAGGDAPRLSRSAVGQVRGDDLETAPRSVRWPKSYQTRLVRWHGGLEGWVVGLHQIGSRTDLLLTNSEFRGPPRCHRSPAPQTSPPGGLLQCHTPLKLNCSMK